MVDWVDGAISNPHPASPEAVKTAENRLRVNLPPDFLAIAALHQGAAPVPANVVLPNGFVTALAHLLHFEASPIVSNIVAAQLPWTGVIDKGIIPFAADIGGDVYCFNYREDYDNPGVAFFSVDFGTVPLASSFTDFVKSLV
ncbi:SMI1/KNR4 family protein [uncultured Devosia sp.]|uniref:SMI1/KNR4 family protein n=1 Tax=uncultured Devosia sp. TaxID=211434 RepID=UPI0035CB8DD2